MISQTMVWIQAGNSVRLVGEFKGKHLPAKESLHVNNKKKKKAQPGRFWPFALLDPWPYLYAAFDVSALKQNHKQNSEVSN